MWKWFSWLFAKPTPAIKFREAEAVEEDDAIQTLAEAFEIAGENIAQAFRDQWGEDETVRLNRLEASLTTLRDRFETRILTRAEQDRDRAQEQLRQSIVAQQKLLERWQMQVADLTARNKELEAALERHYQPTEV
jgi:hypothetical protein